MQKILLQIFIVLLFISSFTDLKAQVPLPVVPPELRGNIDFEREGLHDANRIRTVFFNYGMVGNYPDDPINVDLSIFHSVEVPKGSGENYSDGTTPFVLAKILQRNGRESFIMETGFRERQGTSPFTNKTMRFEPRPGYLQPDPDINKGRSVAISNDPRTWPDQWIDKTNDPDDPGWSGSWNGYFGKAIVADQESYLVYDDNFYDAWDFYPDMRDNTRRGLGLRVEQRGFQWSNPQAGNVIFFHYDISNESTTAYDNNILFGLYMDSGVGGSGIGQDGVAESDDDNAYFDVSAAINLVYTWDKNGRGTRGPTGYLGYSYLETPGNQFDTRDNDLDGILNEARDSGPGQLIVGQDAIRAYVEANYNMTDFNEFHGSLELRPAFVIGRWYTGDEDMDWIEEFNDTGADGVFETNDAGEGDGIPTNGEPNFDQTDIDESDQIGLTGFKMNRIRAGTGVPSTQVDDIVFFDNGKRWPERLYNLFTNPDSSFDMPLVQNYNIGFLFASGPFRLEIGKRERFSLALGFGQNIRELTNTVKVVQQIYKANYQFAVPPPMPAVNAFAGDGYVIINWNDAAERTFDPITNNNDFEGYRIYRSTDPTFLDPQVINTGTGSGPIGNGKPIAQFDLINNIAGYSNTTVEGVSYFLGEDIGLTHTFKDTNVINGQRYFYAVTAYDRGVDSINIYPSENAIAVSQTLRGGTILPQNVVEIYPGKQVLGYQPPEIMEVQQISGTGFGSVNIEIKNPELIPDNHEFQIKFLHSSDSVKASNYQLVDVTAGDTLFSTGSDFAGEGIGPVGKGLLPVISTPQEVQIDTTNTGFNDDANTNVKLNVRYATTLPVNLRRQGFPNNIEVIFSDHTLDTSIAAIGLPQKPAKLKVVAKDGTGFQYNFRMYDPNNDSTLSGATEYIEVLTYAADNPNVARTTWVISVDTSGQYLLENIIPPSEGDVYNLILNVPFSGSDIFSFTTKAQTITAEKIADEKDQKPYVVPNPYVGAASFEPQRFAVSGRGERRIEFRNLPAFCTIRIFTINGELVQTLEHDGNIMQGYLSWDLRSKDNLEIAPGLYIFHVESENFESFIGKFAVIK